MSITLAAELMKFPVVAQSFAMAITLFVYTLVGTMAMEKAYNYRRYNNYFNLWINKW